MQSLLPTINSTLSIRQTVKMDEELDNNFESMKARSVKTGVVNIVNK